MALSTFIMLQHRCQGSALPCRDAPPRMARTKRRAAPADLAEASSGSDDDTAHADNVPEDCIKSRADAGEGRR